MNPNDRKVMNIGVLVVIIALIGAFASGDESSDSAGANGNGGSSELEPFEVVQTGTLTEGNSETFGFEPEARVVMAVFSLTWDDEDDEVGRENDGDTFTLTVRSPDGEERSDTVKNDHNQQGRIDIVFDEDGLLWDGTWEVTVSLDEAGEQWLIFPPVIGTNDDSNDYTLIVTMDYP